MKKAMIIFSGIMLSGFLYLVIMRGTDTINEHEILINGWNTDCDSRDGFRILEEGFMHVLANHTKINYKTDEFTILKKLTDTIRVFKILAYTQDSSAVFCKIIDSFNNIYFVKLFCTKERIHHGLCHEALIEERLIDKKLVWRDVSNCKPNHDRWPYFVFIFIACVFIFIIGLFWLFLFLIRLLWRKLS